MLVLVVVRGSIKAARIESFIKELFENDKLDTKQKQKIDTISYIYYLYRPLYTYVVPKR